jgi:probable HAF family extracellular repeat protein
MTPLPTLGGYATKAWDINNNGDIVGASDTPAQHVRAVLWQNGRIVKLGTLGGKHSSAVLINDRGQVFGWSTLAGNIDPDPHVFRWEKGKMTDLGYHPSDTIILTPERANEVIGVATHSRVSNLREDPQSLHTMFRTWEPTAYGPYLLVLAGGSLLLAGFAWGISRPRQPPDQ